MDFQKKLSIGHRFPHVQALQTVSNDSPASLSGLHDYEPRLEFDDSDFVHNKDMELETSDEYEEDNFLKHSADDGTIEENFENELSCSPVENTSLDCSVQFDDFEDLNALRFVEVVGDDEVGRRVIIISACRLPPTVQLHSDRLLRYLTFTLDKYVELDYTVIYFHHGLTNDKKPQLSWLWKFYKTVDRKYKKNIKALYLVHPSTVLKLTLIMLKPILSAKFGKKVTYLNYLHELNQYVDTKKISIPNRVKQYDDTLVLNPQQIPKIQHEEMPPPSTHQFGVSLQFIKENHPDVRDDIYFIPPIVQQCVEFLSQPAALETEGLFRRSANIGVIKDLERKCNRGEPVSFADQPHIAAVLLKTFLKDLEEPLLTFALYPEILKFFTWSYPKKMKVIKRLIVEMPSDNYYLLKYLMEFLWKVQDRSCVNKMTSNNLAVVFGPNLVWPPNREMTLNTVTKINAFVEFILNNHENIFIL